MSKFYITTPIYYVNDIPHIGHAYTSIAADVIARFQRLDGVEVFFTTGTDEHGQKIEKAAAAAGTPPQQFVDGFANVFQGLSTSLNLSNDYFIRTTDQQHKDFVSLIWQQLENKGLIYLSEYSGWYSVRDECFYQESELVEGKAPTGADVEWLNEESYFFKLASFQEKLLQIYHAETMLIMPESKKNEVIAFVQSGLRDLSISRTTFKWGIEVPTNKNHVMYVWMDALFNYISALHANNKVDFWPCDLHLIGKDILRFHAVYWPAFLLALDLPLPKRIFAHGWWMNDGSKMSKSLGNTINPLALIEKFGIDYSRYFLMRAIIFGNDGNYSESKFIQLINAELANNIGNLVQRVISFVNKNCNSIVPTPSFLTDADLQLIKYAQRTLSDMKEALNNCAIYDGIGCVVKLAHEANVYIDFNPPWQLRKTDIDRMNTVLYVLLDIIKRLGVMLQPFMPNAAEKILQHFSLPYLKFKDIEQPLVINSSINEANPIFMRIVA